MMKDEWKFIISGLKDLITSRYELFLQLINLETDDTFETDEYYSVVKKLGVLTTKENRLISRLNENTSGFVDNYLIYENDFSFNSEKDNDIFLKRLDSILTDANVNMMDETVYDLDDYDDEEDEEDNEYDYISMAEKRLDLEFLCELQKMINNAKDIEREELIKFKYSFILERKMVNDEIETALYNVDNLLNVPLSLEMADIDEDVYKSVEISVTFDMVLELFSDLLVESPESLAGKRAYLIFLLKKLDVIHLQDMEQMTEFCDNHEDSDNMLCVSDISKIIRKIIDHKVLDGNLEYNEICEPLDETTIDNIIAVSKVEKLILDIAEGLTEKDDKDEQFKKLRVLMELEKEMLGNINIHEYNSDRIMGVIDDFVPIFLGEYDGTTSRETFLIIKRMKGALSQIYGLDAGLTTLESEKYCILRNNMLNTLVLYSNLINDIEDEDKRKNYEKVYYEIWFSDYSLTDDFLITQGDADDVIVMDDKFWAHFANVSDIEYGYDKDMKLFEVGHDIIEEIDQMNLDDIYNVCYLGFLDLKLRQIYKNISNEHVWKLKTEFDGINSSKIGECKLLCKSCNKVKKDKTGK